jgi:hypothetical protein
MSNLLRESFLGQSIRFLSRGKVLRYPEELPGFDYLSPVVQSPESDTTNISSASSTHASLADPEKTGAAPSGNETPDSKASNVGEKVAIVGWYGTGTQNTRFGIQQF